MQPDFLHQPIPGISLTGEPGNAPWESPPKYTTIDEVVDFYSDKIIEPDVTKDMLDAIKGNIPLLTIADGMLKMGVMEGLHSIDAAMLAKPILVELMIAMAEIYDVGYVIEADDLIRQRFMPSDVVEKVVEETTQKIAEGKEESGGLIARRKK